MYFGILLVSSLCLGSAVGVTTFNSGAGTVYRLNVTKDLVLEYSGTNYNYLPHLVVGKLPGYLNKRSLLQFQNLPAACSASSIRWAKMYVYFDYAHSIRGQTTRYISRPIQVYQVKKYWSESRATSLRRYHTVVNWADASQGYLQLTGITAGPEVNWVNWSQEYLDLTGNDAGPDVIDTTTIYTKRPSGFVEFDVTDAVKNWRGGNPNYGVLLRATNEYTEGRDIRFYSNAHADKTKHAFINVLCRPLVVTSSVLFRPPS